MEECGTTAGKLLLRLCTLTEATPEEEGRRALTPCRNSAALCLSANGRPLSLDGLLRVEQPSLPTFACLVHLLPAGAESPRLPQLFPLPLPFLGRFEASGPKLSKRNWRLLRLRRALHVLVLALNYVHEGLRRVPFVICFGGSHPPTSGAPTDGSGSFLLRVSPALTVSCFRLDGLARRLLQSSSSSSVFLRHFAKLEAQAAIIRCMCQKLSISLGTCIKTSRSSSPIVLLTQVA